jgi:hypothetical protein
MILPVSLCYERIFVNQLLYKFGRLIGRHLAEIIVLAALAAASVTYLVYRNNHQPIADIPAAAPPPTKLQAPAWDEKKALDEKCAATMPNLIEKATAAYAEKNYDLAVETLWICQGHSSDPKFKNLYTQALTKRNKIKSDETDSYIKAEKARKKKEGVNIGMSEQDVLDSSWGRPEHVNTTTNTYGTRAQWVYGGRNYLYFEDGKLTSIQN